MSTNQAKIIGKYIEDVLSTHDHHIHSFSHCVSRYNGEPYWENMAFHGKEDYYHFKMEYISSKFRNIFRLQRGAKVEYFSITEHPCWENYGVSFDEYRELFEAENEIFKGNFRQVNMGIESNIVHDPTNNEVYIDFRDFRKEETKKGKGISRPNCQEEKPLLDRLKYLNPIIASDHYKHYLYNGNPINTTETYLHLLIQGIKALRELLDQQEESGSGKKVGILGHPWSLPGYFNYADCPSEFAGQKQKTRSQDFFMASDQAPFPYFSKPQLDEICSALVHYRIYPEINHFYIRRGWSDIRIRQPFSKRTILEHYIQFCRNNKKPKIIPIISVGTDMHNLKYIGSTEYEAVAQQVPSITDARVWATVEGLL